MKEKLQTIYEFLINNRKYNYDLQAKYYKSVVTYHNNIKDKVISLLYRIANSQSQPKIDNLARFYQFIHEDIESLNSFSKFVKRVGGKESCYYKDLFEGLKGCDGWGQKTSALFVKSVFHVHNEKYDSSSRNLGRCSTEPK